YAPRFERIVRETGWHVGHVAVDWALDAMGDPDQRRDVLDAAFAHSEADLALVDDADGEYEDVVDVIEELGYRTVGERWLRETDGVPLSLVTPLEDELSSISDGLRFGDPAREADIVPEDEVAVVDLPDDLLAEAQGVDRDAVRDAFERHAYAFETNESGTRVAGRAAFPAADGGGSKPNAYQDLVAALADVLAEKYDAVERRNGCLRVEIEAFDPELASAAGVPEGPAFGKLSNGQSVEVDGETVAPEDVRSVREEEFEV
ncbi:hypothetical protein ACFQDG_17040, partial [Natronoarchaeum mannanilyticum]